jgi:hypothetical protein
VAHPLAVNLGPGLSKQLRRPFFSRF